MSFKDFFLLLCVGGAVGCSVDPNGITQSPEISTEDYFQQYKSEILQHRKANRKLMAHLRAFLPEEGYESNSQVAIGRASRDRVEFRLQILFTFSKGTSPKDRVLGFKRIQDCKPEVQEMWNRNGVDLNVKLLDSEEKKDQDFPFHRVRVQPGEGRAHSDEYFLQSLSCSTVAHEWGHLLGLDDEYYESGRNEIFVSADFAPVNLMGSTRDLRITDPYPRHLRGIVEPAIKREMVFHFDEKKLREVPVKKWNEIDHVELGTDAKSQYQCLFVTENLNAFLAKYSGQSTLSATYSLFPTEGYYFDPKKTKRDMPDVFWRNFHLDSTSEIRCRAMNPQFFISGKDVIEIEKFGVFKPIDSAALLKTIKLPASQIPLRFHSRFYIQSGVLRLGFRF